MAGPAAQLDEAKRFAEIVAILQKHHLVQGLTPEKVRDIFVDLGPTFVKFGQILSMRSDILPKEYCLALESLRTDVTPMPLTEVERILTQAYARPWQEVFSDIGIRPLGSASIAQVHAATLTDGQRVVVKVQRPDLYDIMSRDVRLLKRAAVLLKYTPLASALDFHAVLDEIWRTVQQELDFTIEADNIAEFKRLNDGVAYADCPATFPKWCTKNVLVMQYIGGHQIDDAAGLRADGYDLNEIAVKLVHNYIRQITVYRFFHADPHPGNLRVRDGKIVWLDMGMMGSLDERQRTLIGKAVTGVARGDINLCRDAVMGLGEFHGKTDKRRLYRDIEDLLDKYGSADLGSMDLAQVFEDLSAVMKANGISMPGSLTMLARGLATIEGVVADLSPQINVMSVVTARLGDQMLHQIDWRAELVQDSRAVYESAHKSLEIPALLADLLRTGLKGEANLGVEHHPGADLAQLLGDITFKLAMALIAAALLVCGGLLHDVSPLAGGLSAYSIGCFVLAAGLLGWAFLPKGRKRKK